MDALALLGYPGYFRYLLGAAKLLAALVLVVRMAPRTAREWAYAGLGIELCSALFSYAAAAPTLGRLLPPVGVGAVVAVSYRSWRAGAGRR